MHIPLYNKIIFGIPYFFGIRMQGIILLAQEKMYLVLVFFVLNILF